MGVMVFFMPGVRRKRLFEDGGVLRVAGGKAPIQHRARIEQGGGIM
jgi:hypothetical protein